MATIAALDAPTVARRATESDAATLCTTEYGRLSSLLRELSPDDWAKPTDCTRWTVRDLVGHLVGAAENTGLMSMMRLALAGIRVQRRERLGDIVDGMNEVQIEALAGVATDELLGRMNAAAPKQVAARLRPAWYARTMPLPTPHGVVSLRELNVRVLNRDLWIHRVDICRATGRAMVLTPDHDGRLVEDIVAQWAANHGRPYTLRLDGPAGGAYVQGTGGDELQLDAVEFCRIVSLRAAGEGLLATPVLF